MATVDCVKIFFWENEISWSGERNEICWRKNIDITAWTVKENTVGMMKEVSDRERFLSEVKDEKFQV